MAKLKFNRGESSRLPELFLEPGEPAFALDTGKLYIGNGMGQKILINPDMLSALQADKLSTEREIRLDGDVLGSIYFDGSQNVTIVTAHQKSGVTAGTYSKLTIDEKGRVLGGATIGAEDIPPLSLEKLSDAGTACRYNVGMGRDNIPLLSEGGKLPVSVIPATAITDTFVVPSESKMVELEAQTGDIAVRTDLNKCFILKSMPSSVLSNWQELLTPAGGVSSVNGMAGTVLLTAADILAVPIARTINKHPLSADISLSKADIGLSNVINESKITMFTNPVFTGSAKAETPASSDNGTNIATTAFVKAQGYMASSDIIDGGVF